METGKVITLNLTEEDRTVILTAKECRRITELVKRSMTDRMERANLLFSDYIDEIDLEIQKDLNLLFKISVPLSSIRSKDEKDCD